MNLESLEDLEERVNPDEAVVAEGFLNKEAMLAYAEENGRSSGQTCLNCDLSCEKILSEYQQNCPVLSGVSGFESKSHKIDGFSAFINGFKEVDSRVTPRMAKNALELFKKGLN